MIFLPKHSVDQRSLYRGKECEHQYDGGEPFHYGAVFPSSEETDEEELPETIDHRRSQGSPSLSGRNDVSCSTSL
jgi:hypothetical protein